MITQERLQNIYIKLNLLHFWRVEATGKLEVQQLNIKIVLKVYFEFESDKWSNHDS